MGWEKPLWMVPNTCPKSKNKHWWLLSWKPLCTYTPGKLTLFTWKWWFLTGISSSRRFHVSFPVCKKYWRTEKTQTHQVASSIIPLWLRFFLTPVVFPSPLHFFLGTFFPAICRDLETFILQVVKTPTRFISMDSMFQVPGAIYPVITLLLPPLPNKTGGLERDPNLRICLFDAWKKTFSQNGAFFLLIYHGKISEKKTQ